MSASTSGSRRSRWRSREARPTLLDLFDRIGWDRLLFATDYPHWDFDDPRTAFKANLSEAQRHQLLYANARKFYGLDG